MGYRFNEIVVFLNQTKTAKTTVTECFSSCRWVFASLRVFLCVRECGTEENETSAYNVWLAVCEIYCRSLGLSRDHTPDFCLDVQWTLFCYVGSRSRGLCTNKSTVKIVISFDHEHDLSGIYVVSIVVRPLHSPIHPPTTTHTHTFPKSNTYGDICSFCNATCHIVFAHFI